jgi:hypothetical protein
MKFWKLAKKMLKKAYDFALFSMIKYLLDCE